MKFIDKNVIDGLYKKNTVLVSGMAAAPLIICADTLKRGIIIIYSFSMITFFSIIISSLLPKKIVYTLRIILYTLIASLVYVPVWILAKQIFGMDVYDLGIYFPLIIVNAMIVSQTELNYFKLSRQKIPATVLFYILGFDITAFIFSFVREIFAYGTINGNIVGVSLLTDGFAKPYGGFILLGVFAAVFRFITDIIKNWKTKTEK